MPDVSAPQGLVALAPLALVVVYLLALVVVYLPALAVVCLQILAAAVIQVQDQIMTNGIVQIQTANEANHWRIKKPNKFGKRDSNMRGFAT